MIVCSMNTVYLWPPCLLKAHASATTWPVALLATGTQSMEEISQPNMLDSCLRSSCEVERQQNQFSMKTEVIETDTAEWWTGRKEWKKCLLTALMSWRVIDFFFSTTWPKRPNISWTAERKWERWEEERGRRRKTSRWPRPHVVTLFLQCER